MQNIFVTATDTEVGKTVVTGGLARILTEEGERVGVLKPVETGWTEAEKGLLPPDADFLTRGARMVDTQEAVTYTYAEPLAPLVAARRENRPVDAEKLLDSYNRLVERYDRVLVEGAGGLSVPITDTLDMAGLAAQLDLPLLVVTRPVLGTLNHTFLTVHYARSRGLPVAGVVINGYREDTTDIAERTNPEMIEEMCEVPVLGRVPRRPKVESPRAAAEMLRQSLDIDRLEARLQTIAA